jgi:hypothetical protein
VPDPLGDRPDLGGDGDRDGDLVGAGSEPETVGD